MSGPAELGFRRLEADRPPLPEEGDLSFFNVAELLHICFAWSIDGILTISRDGVDKVVHLVRGAPVYVDSPLPSESLLSYLRRVSLVPDDLRREIMKQAREEGLSEKDVLVGRGFFTPEELAESMTAHMTEMAVSLFAWEEGSFSLNPDADAAGAVTTQQLFPARIILDGIARHYSEERIAKRFEIPDEACPFPREKAPYSAEQLRLSAVEKLVFDMACRRAPFSELIQLSGGDRLVALRLLYGLYVMELLGFEIGRPPQEPGGLGRPSSVVGRPSSAPSQPPGGLGRPSSVVGRPSSAPSQPPGGLGRPSSVVGRPSSAPSRPPSGLGRPSSVGGRPSSAPSRPPGGLGRPSSVVGRPSSAPSRPPSGLGRPSSVVGRPSSAPSRPPSGLGRPSSVVGRPSSAPSRPPSGLGRPSSVVGRPSSAPSRPPGGGLDRPTSAVTGDRDHTRSRASAPPQVPGAEQEVVRPPSGVQTTPVPGPLRTTPLPEIRSTPLPDGRNAMLPPPAATAPESVEGPPPLVLADPADIRHFHLLGVDTSVTIGELREAFTTQIGRFSPEELASLSPEERAQVNETRTALTEAYKTASRLIRGAGVASSPGADPLRDSILPEEPRRDSGPPADAPRDSGVPGRGSSPSVEASPPPAIETSRDRPSVPIRPSAAPPRPTNMPVVKLQVSGGRVVNASSPAELLALPISGDVTQEDLDPVSLPVLLFRALANPTINGALSLRMEGLKDLVVPVVKGSLMLLPAERATLLQGFTVVNGQYVFDGRVPPDAERKSPTAALGIVMDGIRGQIRTFESLDMVDALGPRLELGPKVKKRHLALLAKMGLSTIELRVANNSFDGTRPASMIIDAAGSMKRTVIQLLLAFTIYDLFEWSEVDVSAGQSLAEELEERAAKLEEINYFEVLDLHWSADSQDVERVFDRLSVDVLPGGRYYDASPEACHRIYARLEEARELLVDGGRRVRYRSEVYPDRDFDAVADFLGSKEKALTLHTDQRDLQQHRRTQHEVVRTGVLTTAKRKK